MAHTVTEPRFTPSTLVNIFNFRRAANGIRFRVRRSARSTPGGGTNVRQALGRFLMLTLVVTGTSCHPIGLEGELNDLAAEETGSPCGAIADVINANSAGAASFLLDGVEPSAPRAQVFKVDLPSGEGRIVRTLCPTASGCDSAFLYGETVDGVVTHDGSGPAPQFILAKVNYAAPDSNAVAVFLDGWNASGTKAAHDDWSCFPWSGEFRFSFRGIEGVGHAAVTFEFWNSEAVEAPDGKDEVRWSRSPAAGVTMQAAPNEQCHCCDACVGGRLSDACGLTGRVSARECPVLDSVFVGNARVKIMPGDRDPAGIARVWRLDNGDIQFQCAGCRESVILTPAPDYLAGWSVADARQASGDPIRIRSHQDRRILEFQRIPEAAGWRLHQLLDEAGATEALYEYDAEGRIERIHSVSPASGSYLGFAYDASGRLETITPYVGGVAAADRARRLLYDGRRVKGVANAACSTCGSSARLFYYNRQNRLSRITNHDDVELERFSYDGHGRLIRHDRLNDQNTLVTVRTLDYDLEGAGHAVTVTVREPVSATEERMYLERYDVDGRLAAVTRYPALFPRGGVPEGASLTTDFHYSYDRDAVTGQTTKVMEETNPAGATSVTMLQAFDEGAPALPNAFPDRAALVRFEKMKRNLRLSDPAVDPSKRVRHRWSWTRGRDGGIINLTLARAEFQETAAAFVTTRRVDDRGVTDLTYSDGGRLVSRRGPVVTLLDGGGAAHSLTTYAYDARGRLIRAGRGSTQRDTVITAYEYDEAGRLIAQTENASALEPQERPVTRYGYSPFGERTQVIDPRGTVTETTRDAVGRITDEAVYPHGDNGSVLTQTRQEYGAGGKVVRRRGAVHVGPFYKNAPQRWADTTYIYDLMGRVLSESTPGPDESRLTTSFHYDDQGRIIRQTNADGSIERFKYDGLGREVERTAEARGAAPLGNRRLYDQFGRLAESRSPSGVATSYTYDQFGRQIATETGNRLRTEYVYDDAGRITRTLLTDLLTGRALSDTTCSYDELGRKIVTRHRLRKGTDSEADPVRLTVFDARGESVAIIDKADGNNDLSKYEVGDRRQRTRYDELGRAVERIDPLETPTRMAYDAGGLVLSQTIEPGGFHLTTTYTRDALGRTRRVTGAEGHYTTFDYDSRGKLAQHRQFDRDGVPLTQTRVNHDLAGETTRSVRRLDPAGTLPADPAVDAIIDRRYHAGGQAGAGRLAETTQYTGDSPQATRVEYDGLGRPVRLSQALDPEVNYEAIAYEPGTGRVAARTFADPMGVRRFDFEYDSADHPIRVTEVGGGDGPNLETKYVYDGLGRLLCVIAPDNTETRIRYDLLGREVERVEDATGYARVTRRQYDRQGNLTALIAATGAAEQTTHYAYDQAGRLTSVRYPDHGLDGRSGEVEFEYDAADRLVRRTDQRGIITRYAYDGRGLVTRRVVPAMNVDDTYTYDGAGRLTAYRRDDRHDGKRTYDGLGHMVEERQTVDGVTRIVTYTHNAQGDRTGMTYPAEADTVLTYEYDALGNNTSICRGDRPVVEYDFAGNFMTGRRSLTTREKIITTLVTYDPHRRISGIANTADAVNLSSSTIGRDARGAVASIRRSSDETPAWNTAYEYDSLQRLTRATYTGLVTGTEAFDYDAYDNRLHYSLRLDERETPDDGWHYQSTAANEYLAIGRDGVTSAVQYDAAGNLILDETGYGYIYDHDNQLTRVFADANRNGAFDAGEVVHATYAYDALGRRIRAAVGDRALQYFYDDHENVLVEYESDRPTTPYRWYIHGTTDIDERAVMYTNAPAVGAPGTDDYYFLLDHQYSVAGLVGNQGRLVEWAQYDAYGKPTAYRLDGDNNFDGAFDHAGADAAGLRDADQINSAPAHGALMPQTFVPRPAGRLHDYYFTGRRVDMLDSSARPLQFSRARYYDFSHGRFLQRDPAHYLDGLNLYSYGRGNPANFRDPGGLKSSGGGPVVTPDLGTLDEIKSVYGCSCVFTIKVDAFGLEYDGPPQTFLQTLVDANLTREEMGVGHSWVRLAANGDSVEGGQTGMRSGKAGNPEITFKPFVNSAVGLVYLSVLPVWAPSPLPDLREYADPRNPAAWLHYTYKDGYWAEGSSTHRIATDECSWCLTGEQAQAVRAEIDRLRESGGGALRNFGLTVQQCTTVARGIAEKGGIELDPFVDLVLPNYVRVRLFSLATVDLGIKLRLWTTRPEVSMLHFAVPDKMAREIQSWEGPEEYHKICRP